MSMKLKFNNIKNRSIFQPEFQSFSANGYNVIEFKKQSQTAGGIAVIYAPNGTGKSSLTAVLGSEQTREERENPKYLRFSVSRDRVIIHRLRCFFWIEYSRAEELYTPDKQWIFTQII